MDHKRLGAALTLAKPFARSNRTIFSVILMSWRAFGTILGSREPTPSGAAISAATRVVRALKAGRIFINSYGDADPIMAFGGGYKQSGLGREYGQESIDAYTQVKSVWARL